VFFLGTVGNEAIAAEELLPRRVGKKRDTKGLRVARQPQMIVVCTSIVDQIRSSFVVPVRVVRWSSSPKNICGRWASEGSNVQLESAEYSTLTIDLRRIIDMMHTLCLCVRHYRCTADRKPNLHQTNCKDQAN
jgi:hypothetical protein